MARRHLTGEQRRGFIKDELRENPERSNRQIADALKVDHEMVGAQRKELESTGGIRHVSQTIDSKGRKQETSKKPPAKNKGGRPRKIISITALAVLEKRYGGTKEAVTAALQDAALSPRLKR